MIEPQESIRRGATNAVVTCMGVTRQDRVFILGDNRSANIADALAAAARSCGAPVQLALLEAYVARPILALPDRLRRDLSAFAPTVTFYTAAGLKGEITFRIGLRRYILQHLRVRHAHMIGISERLMQEGMVADYNEVARLTHRVIEVVRPARTIVATSPEGTNLVVTFDSRLRWIACTGLYHQQGDWGNLPEGEVFTCPATAHGVVAARELGDYFSDKYGVLDAPVFFEIHDGEVTGIRGANQAVVDDVWAYVLSAENGRRVGEFAIGTNNALKQLCGNLLQDEKLPGMHVAFGDALGHETGADWASPIHVDVIPILCTIVVDDKPIMVDGTFTLPRETT